MGKHLSNSNVNRKKESNNKRVKSNKLRVAFIIIAIAFIVINVKFYTSVIKTNMLPMSYIAIFTTAIIIFAILLIIGLTKKHKTLKLNILCLLIIVVISVGYIFATHYIDITMDWLKEMLGEIAEEEHYYVVVNNNSPYNKIEDVKDKNIYAFQLEEDVKIKIQDKVKNEIIVSDDILKLGNDLLDNKIDAILISSFQYGILSEEIENFKENTKIIATEAHKIETEAKIEDENTKYNIKNGSFNIYVSGIDVFGNINKVARTDANVLITVNLDTHEILLTSIPRDYYVTLHSKKAKDKLTHSGIYGITETVTTVEDLLGIDINYYVRVNFTTLVKLIDTLGGIDVNSDYAFTVNDPWEYKQVYRFNKGNNHISGEAALAFSRERNSFTDGDNQRIKNQQKVIEGIINKVSKSTTILTKYNSILNSLSGSFNTNIDQKEISAIVKKQLEDMPNWTIKTISLTGTPATRSTYSMGSQQLYVTIPDQKSVNDAKAAIEDVMKE